MEALKLYEGRGQYKQNPVEAARLFGMAAELGHAPAQHSLAVMVYYGQGKLERNERSASMRLSLSFSLSLQGPTLNHRKILSSSGTHISLQTKSLSDFELCPPPKQTNKQTYRIVS